MTEAYTKMIQQMMESSQEMMRTFNPALENIKAAGFDKMFPTMSKDMMEMWFGRTFNREGLDAKTRLLVTVAALTVLGAQAEPQLKMTVRHALEAGATQREIAEVIWQMSMFGGLPAMQKALEIAQTVFAETATNSGEKDV
ncbi:carboxymuconolactone decarboxylase family protein [Pseudotabrizicola sp. L79]|uniref:carboxymuconolactone decarboxylase family protein n=1 Tax=Pseudotabrizicola sp. L79 TaxID=3118402 RepID=UPI002F92EAC7